jgi:hypothetical protein
MPETEKPGTSNAAKLSQFVGTMEPYLLGEDFKAYLQRFDNYIELNGVKDEVFKIQLLTNMMGPTASAKLYNACKPKFPKNFKYTEIVEKCSAIFYGQKWTIAEHYKFNNRNQRMGERASDFAIELQAMAENCKFGEFLDTALRDRFVAGLRNSGIKAKILNDSRDQKFDAIVTMAVSSEMVEENVRIMAPQSEIHAVRGRQNGRLEGRLGTRDRSSSQHRSDNRHQSRQRRPFTDNRRCYICRRIGHLANSCTTRSSDKYRTEKSDSEMRRNKFRKHKNSVNSCETDVKIGDLRLSESDSSVNGISSVDLNTHKVFPIFDRKLAKTKTMVVRIADKNIEMECDTGSCVSLCSWQVYSEHFSHLKLERIDIPLTVITGEQIKVKGQIKVRVKYSNIRTDLFLVVVDSGKIFTPLLGRDWLDVLCPKWRTFFEVNSVFNDGKDDILKDIKAKYAILFDDDLKTPIKGHKVDIQLVDDAQPIFFKAYTLPFNLRERVSSEIDRLCDENILKPVQISDWASPIVVVTKDGKDIRMCVDFSVTLNKMIKTGHYPLPVIDEVLASLVGSEHFCVLDMKGAYTQLEVKQSCQPLLTINTIKGLFSYTRLPFGIKPAAGIFQSVMDNILNGLSNVFCYIDDILIGDQTIEGLQNKLILVLDRLLRFNVKVNWKKCKFFVDKVIYLGHEISKDGIAPSKRKIEAITSAPQPKTVVQLQSFIGLVNYYSKFIPHLNQKLRVFYDLIKKDADWQWSSECTEAFEYCKKAIVSGRILEHYDPKKKIVIVCDASDDGLSGILCHIVDGSEKPVFFVSRTLSKAEKNYPILHREALAIVFSLERFYKYIFGHEFVVYTDHKPLLGILKPKKGEPPVVANRLQRYIIRCSIFEFALEYRKGKDNGNADCLSRLPVENIKRSIDDIEEEKLFEVKMLSPESKMDLNLKIISEETMKDGFLKKLYSFILNGWKVEQLPIEYKAYFLKNKLLTIEFGCIIYNSRVVIPSRLQGKILSLLHINHSGIVRMKQLARSYVFWQNIDRDIENYVKSCDNCQAMGNDRKFKSFGKWPDVTVPFERVHLDFFYFNGKQFLIFVDCYSRWLEIKLMENLTANCLIMKLDSIFEIFGFCGQCVTDNGPPYNSYEFAEYCEMNDIELLHSPPYHPASNGIVERAVQSVKSVLKKIIYDDKISNFQLLKEIDKFLENYRNMPHTEKNIIPSHLIFKFKPKKKLDCLKPEIKKPILKKTVNKNSNEAKNLDEEKYPSFKKIEFDNNENIWYRNYFKGSAKWIKAKVVKRKTDHVYLINVNGLFKLAHSNQLKKLIKRKASFEKCNEKIEDREDQPFEVRRSTRQRKQPDWLKINKL